MSNQVDHFEDIETVQIHFVEEDQLKLQELSSFLYHSKIIYSHLYQSMTDQGFKLVDYVGFESESFEAIQAERELFINELNETIPKKGWGKINLASKELDEDDIYINKVSKQSPFTIEFIGVGIIILIIVSICSGSARLHSFPPKFEIELNKTLGEGLQDIKQVFSDNSNKPEKP